MDRTRIKPGGVPDAALVFARFEDRRNAFGHGRRLPLQLDATGEGLAQIRQQGSQVRARLLIGADQRFEGKDFDYEIVASGNAGLARAIDSRPLGRRKLPVGFKRTVGPHRLAGVEGCPPRAGRTTIPLKAQTFWTGEPLAARARP